MGYMLVFGPCLVCHRVFGYNPHHVPSMHWPQPDGEREPICLECMERGNTLREAEGMAPFAIHPEAYEPAPDGLPSVGDDGL